LENEVDVGFGPEMVNEYRDTGVDGMSGQLRRSITRHYRAARCRVQCLCAQPILAAGGTLDERADLAAQEILKKLARR